MRLPLKVALPAVLVAAGLTVVLSTGPASAASIVVNTNDDELNADGDCSLREAVQAASTNAAVDACTAGSGGDTITFAASTDGSPIGASGGLNIGDLTINGNGRSSTRLETDFNVNNTTAALANLTVTEPGGVLNVNSGGAGITTTFTATNVTFNGGLNINSGFGSVTNATFSGVVATGDDLTVNSGFDGSITTFDATNSTLSEPFDVNASTDSDTTVTLTRTTVSGVAGLAIASNLSEVTLVNSTVSGNGGAFELSDSQLALVNSTVADNGAGLEIDAESTATLTNTILANTGDECVDQDATSSGGNVADDDTCGLAATGDQQTVDPALGALGSNGGATATHLPADTSPAVDGGVAAGCPSTDQRGETRPQDGDDDGTAACDSGAVELAGAATEPPPDDGETPRGTNTPPTVAGTTTGPPPAAPAARPVTANPAFTG